MYDRDVAREHAADAEKDCSERRLPNDHEAARQGGQSRAGSRKGGGRQDARASAQFCVYGDGLSADIWQEAKAKGPPSPTIAGDQFERPKSDRAPADEYMREIRDMMKAMTEQMGS